MKGSIYGNPLAGMIAMSMIASAGRKKRKALPKEEQERIFAETEELKEKKRVSWFLHQGKCPYCGEKLVRGKKTRANNYKRVWSCFKCHKDLSE